MADLKSLSISMGVVLTPLTSAIDTAKKTLSDFASTVSGSMSDATSKIQAAAPQMMSTGAAMSGAFTLPLSNLKDAALETFGTFEASMNRVSAMGGIVGEDLKKLADQAKTEGARTVFSAVEAAEAQGNLAAAGWNAQQILGGLPAVLDLAAAGQLSMSDASAIAANTLGAFNLPAEQMGTVSDVLAKAAAMANQSVGDLGYTFKTVGPVANAAGMTVQQVAAATTLMANAGIKGEQAGTSLRGVLGSLIAPSKQQAELLDSMGVRTTDAAGKFRGLDTVLGDLRKASINTNEMFRIFGRESASAAAVLINSGPGLKELESQMYNSSGAAKEMADTLMNGLTGAKEEWSGASETLIMSLGEVLAPIMTQLYQIGQKLISEFLMPAVEWFSTLDPSIQTATVAFLGILSAIGPVMLGIGAIAAFGVSATFLAWSAAIAAVGAVLVGLGVWISNNWDGISRVVTQAWEGLSEMWMGIWNPVVSALEAVWNGLVTIWNTATQPLVNAFNAVWNGLGSAIDGARQIVADNIGKIVLALSPVLIPIGVVVAAIAGIGYALYLLGVALYEEGTKCVAILTNMWNGIQSIWTNVWNSITSWFTGLITSIGQTIQTAWNSTVQFVQNVWTGITEFWTTAWNSITTAVTELWNTFTAFVMSVFDPVIAYVQNLWSSITEFWSMQWTSIKEGIGALWTSFTEYVSSIFQPVVNWVTGAWDELLNAWTLVWTNVQTWLQGALGGLYTTVVDSFNSIVTSAQAAWKSVTDAISGTLTWVKDNVPGMSKLLSLDEAWAGPKKVEEAHKELVPEIKKTTEATKDLEGAVTRADKAKKEKIKTMKEAKTVWKQLGIEVSALAYMMQQQVDANKKARQSLIEYTAQWVLTSDGWNKTLTEHDKLLDKLGQQDKTLGDLSKFKVPEYVASLNSIKKPVSDVYDALDKMGIKSVESFTKARTEAEKTYQTIMSSDKVSQYEKDAALIKYFQAVQSEAQVTGQKIDSEFLKAVQAAKNRVGNTESGLPSIQGQFKKFGTEISTTMQDLSNGLFDSFFGKGNKSFGERMESALSSLGKSAWDLFIKPFQDMVIGPNGILIKALNPLQDKLTDIVGGWFGVGEKANSNFFNDLFAGKGIFGDGGLTGKTPTATQTPSGALGGIGAGVSSMVSTITQAIGAAGSVLTAITNLRLEGTMNAVEENTRYLKIATTEGEWSISKNTGACRELLGYVVDDLRGSENGIFHNIARINTAMGYLVVNTDDIKASAWALSRLNGELTVTAPKAEGYLDRIATGIESLVSQNTGNTYNITVNTSGSNENVADAIVQAIKTA